MTTLTINPSIRYSRLEKTNGQGNYFEGSIARLNLRYQFSNEFNVRLVSQKNTFTDQFFIQPLVQWNPNPSTIFYLGGNQNTIEEIEGAHFQLLQFNQTQFFFKFQYLDWTLKKFYLIHNYSFFIIIFSEMKIHSEYHIFVF